MGTQSATTIRASSAQIVRAPNTCALQVTLAVAERALRQAECAVRMLSATIFLAVKEASAAAMPALARVANAARISMAINIQSLKPPSACHKDASVRIAKV